MTPKSNDCNISPRKKKKRESSRLTLEGRILQDLSNLSRVCIPIQKIKSILFCALICNQFLEERFILKQSLNGPVFFFFFLMQDRYALRTGTSCLSWELPSHWVGSFKKQQRFFNELYSKEA